MPRTLTLAVAGRPYLAGRAETCALCLAVEEVSREHAAFARGADGVVVRDLGSKNGVVLRGVRVAGEAVLGDGDLIQIGPVTLPRRPRDPLPPRARANPPRPAHHRAPASPGASPPPPSPPIPEPVSSAPPERSSTQLTVVVAVSVLLLLAVAVVAIFRPRG